MSSYFARLKEDLDAKHHDIQEHQASVESIEKLTRELEAQKKELAKKAAELEHRKDEAQAMQNRIDALTAAESAIDEAMHTKSSTQDVVKHVMENAIRSDHMTGSEIAQTALMMAGFVNGRSDIDNLRDLLFDILTDGAPLEAALEAGMENLPVQLVVKYAVAMAIDKGASPAALMDSVKGTVIGMLGRETAAVEHSKKPQAAQKENRPSAPPSPATPVTKNTLRGQAADFKPLKDPQKSWDPKAWQNLARHNRFTGGR